MNISETEMNYVDAHQEITLLLKAVGFIEYSQQKIKIS